MKKVTTLFNNNLSNIEQERKDLYVFGIGLITIPILILFSLYFYGFNDSFWFLALLLVIFVIGFFDRLKGIKKYEKNIKDMEIN